MPHIFQKFKFFNGLQSMRQQLKLWSGVKTTTPPVHAYRASHLKNAYGLTLAKYYRLLRRQDGKCAICSGINETYGEHRIESLCVDHDHKTGKIRGLLCHKCNRAIGNVNDRADLLRKMADYLERGGIEVPDAW